MRLIDADKLIEDMSNKWDMQDLYLPIHFKELLIDEQPTAFDVDKVVEQLEENYFLTESTFDDDGYCNDDSEEVVNLNEAIEIVRNGGIDEYDRE